VSRRAAPATYCYCVVQAPRAPVLGGAPAGLPGLGPPRAVPVDPGVWLVAADAPPGRYEAAAIERRLRDLDWVSRCAVGHEAVIEHAARRGSVVPMKLFTLFASDARALAHLRRARRRLAAAFRRVAGRQEWGVRVFVDERAARRGGADGAPPPAAVGAGTRFLLRRQAEQGATHRLVAEGRREAERLFRRLRRETAAARRRSLAGSPPGSRLVLDAVFLVPRERAGSFRTHGRRLGRALAARGLELRLTGPWPPYHFVERGPAR